MSSSYKLDLELLKSKAGTFENPHLLDLTPGQRHESVIAHVKYDDGSVNGKFFRYF